MTMFLIPLLVGNLFFGNHFYNKGNFDKALRYYDRGKNEKYIYNRGNAYYKKGNYDKAIENWKELLDKKINPNLKFKTYYNIGNGYFKKGEYEKAIKSYENALNIKPYDENARYNLELAKKMLKKRKQHQQNRQSKKNVKNSKSQNRKKSQNKKNAMKNKYGKNNNALPKNEKEYLKKIEQYEKQLRKKNYFQIKPYSEKDLERKFMEQNDQEGYFLNKKDW